VGVTLTVGIGTADGVRIFKGTDLTLHSLLLKIQIQLVLHFVQAMELGSQYHMIICIT
jgi:hypothetical protein